MRWSDEAVVLTPRRHGESALIVQLLTRGHGRHAALVRGGQGRRLRPLYQTGNRLLVTWNARLAEHLGTVSGELLRGYAAQVMDDRARLACLAAAASMAEALLPEREPHPAAYEGLLALFEALEADAGWAVAYVEWEMLLLRELGFGLELARCAATGAAEDLAYVSPKSGQAVSAAAGEPYRDRLLRLPGFLRPDGVTGPPAVGDVADGLELAGFFLERRVVAPQGRKLPAARSRFVDVIRQFVTISSG